MKNLLLIITLIFTSTLYSQTEDRTIKEYYDSGELLREGTYGANNLAIGKWTFYYKNGNKKMEITYSNSESLSKEGKRKIYYENGQLREVANYVNGVKVGVWSVYDSTGKKLFDVEELTIKKSQYNDDKIRTGVWQYIYDSGVIAKEETYDGTLTYGESRAIEEKYYNRAGQEIEKDPSDFNEIRRGIDYKQIDSDFFISEIELGEELYIETELDQYPIFHGCNESNGDLKACFYKNLDRFIRSQIDVPFQLEFSSRISLKVVVNKKGKVRVTEARGDHPMSAKIPGLLNMSFTNFKSIKPATINGKNVDFIFMVILR